MKLLVISTHIFKVPLTGYGGLEAIAWQCAKGLAAKGHDVALVAPEGSECPGVEIITGGSEGTDEKLAYSRYWHRLPEFDCIISHDWQKWAYVLKQEGKLKAPVLGVCHAPVNTMMQSPPPVDKPCMVCISDDQRQHFEALFGKPARTAHNGIDLEFYKPIPGVKRTNRFLFLARFSSVKSPDIAIEACKKAGVGLDLVGDTRLTGEPEYLQSILHMADGRQIRFIGPTNRGETVWWYTQAHALVHPVKNFREPFGLVPVEAMACGSPVIAWDHGAMRETVESSRTGTLVSSIDELVQAIRDSVSDWNDVDPRKRYYCREWASRFSEQNMVNRYHELCEEAVKTGGW